MNASLQRIATLVIGAALTFAPLGCSKGQDAAEQAVPGRSVHVVELKARDLILSFEDSAALEAVSDVTLTSQVSGEVVEVRASLGDSCAKDDVLLRIDPESYRLSAEQARANYLAAKAAAEYMEAEYARLLPLYQKGDLSKSQMQKTELDYRRSESEHANAKAAKELAEKNLRETEIRCPFAGVVAERFVDFGQTVSIGAKLVNVVDLTSVKITVGASERDVVGIAPGAKASVSVDALPAHTYAGVVTQVGRKATGPSRTFPVEVRIENADGELRAGMVARAIIEKEQRTGAIAIPFDIIQFDATGRSAWVFVAVEGKAQRREVTLGPKVGTDIIVERGLSAGDKLVTLGSRALADGVALEVKPAVN